jgi:AAA family ATPase
VSEIKSGMGIRPSRGVLLYGPPGCSKTLLAKAFATESGLNFLAVKGPELISKFVGDTEHNIREIFSKARAAAPSVIFFDEFDAMARRDTGHDSLSPVTALLTEMDGVVGLSGVFVLAATNRPQVIDRALLRPGRINSIVYVGPPNLKAREEILKISTRKMPLSKSVNFQDLAKRTEGWSGAEVTELCDQAGDAAAVEFEFDVSNLVITPAHFDAAFGEIRPVISQEMIKELEDWKAAVDR